MNPKPQRAQGGLGLLSRSISVQKSQQSIPKVLILERRGRNREKRRAPGRGSVLSVRPGQEREGVRGVFNPNNSHPKRLESP